MAHTGNHKYLTTTAVAARASISRDTLLRWLKDGKVPEPSRDRNGWRIFTETEAQAVVRYANKVVPSPLKRQKDLFKARVR